ncbi:MAG: AAA family ATPase [Tannerellaceae bacterium]|jgi:hypothetical protein|nr:AAA family ATPase [Tannerellaceae bacterium]
MENKQPAVPAAPASSVLQTVVLWRQSRLQVTDSFSVPPEAIRVHNSVIGTLGNFSASTGKAKSKKTFNVSAIVAAALGEDAVLCYRASLPEGKRKILYVDTEQSPYHCIRTMKRILQLAGRPVDRHPLNLEFLSLRRYTPDVRQGIIEQAIYGTPDLGLVIIDGIRDLVYDINSPGEATHIISRLMQWTDERQIHIHTVLHLNKGDDHTRGHIGTELNNKAECVLCVTKDETDGDVSRVSAMHIRDIEFEPFAFRINEEALPCLVDGYSPKRKAQPRGCSFDTLTEAEHARALAAAFEGREIRGHETLIEALQKGYASVGFERGRNITLDLKKYLMNRQVISRQGKEFHYHEEALRPTAATRP